MPPPTEIFRENLLPADLQNSYQDGGPAFFNFVADPTTAWSYRICLQDRLEADHSATISMSGESVHTGRLPGVELKLV